VGNSFGSAGHAIEKEGQYISFRLKYVVKESRKTYFMFFMINKKFSEFLISLTTFPIENSYLEYYKCGPRPALTLHFKVNCLTRMSSIVSAING
jgi:hypothetical protein